MFQAIDHNEACKVEMLDFGEVYVGSTGVRSTIDGYFHPARNIVFSERRDFHGEIVVAHPTGSRSTGHGVANWESGARGLRLIVLRHNSPRSREPGKRNKE